MYHFYINETLMPLPPERMTTRVGSTNEVINLVSSGDYNILKDIGLTDFSFDVFLPAKPTTVSGILTYDDFKPPSYYQELFYEYKKNKEYVRLIIIRNQVSKEVQSEPTNMLVAFEDYTIQELGHDEASVNVRLKFREHRPPKETKTKIAYITTNESDQLVAQVYQEEIRPTKPKEKTHTVISGDTLWGIAQRKLGSGARFREIAELNNIVDPNLIFPNQVLRLPT